MTALAGETATLASWAGNTVREEEEVRDPEVAEMVAAPGAMPVTSPLAEIDAADVFEEYQIADDVMSAVLPSVKVPVALNCTLSPLAMLEFCEETAIAVSLAGPTVRAAELEVTAPETAAMAALPTPVAEANPAAVRLAMDLLELSQVTFVVISAVEPPVYVPTALYCCVWPFEMLALAGVIAIAVRAGLDVIVRDAVLESDPSTALMVATPAFTPLVSPAEVTAAIAD